MSLKTTLKRLRGAPTIKDSTQHHHAAVESIALQVQDFYNTKQHYRIYHGDSSSTRRPVDPSSSIVDTSALDRRLEIDTMNKVAVVEANVPMDALLEATLKLNLMPLVVTKFPGITVGGAYSGTAGESSSFKHRFFDRTVVRIEMVLANGETVNCAATENEAIFRGAPGALGTLGVVTLLHLQLQPAAKWVEVTYHPFSSTDTGIEMFRRFAREEQEIDYLDGIMFSPTSGAVVTGQHHDLKPAGAIIQRLSWAEDPWYYMHVEERISSVAGGGDALKELIPLLDYLFRYNRGCFWCGKSVFDVAGLPFTKTTRRLFDFALRTRMLYKAVHAQDPTTLMMIQDLVLPFSAAEDFVDWQAKRFDIWPLWLCPLRVSPMPTLHPHPLKSEDKQEELMLNVGLYGTSPRTYEEWITANGDLEDKVTALGGMKWAYAAQLYSGERFWAQYDKSWYGKLREKCHATSLPDIYQKTSVDVDAGRRTVKEMQEYRDGKGWSSQALDRWGNLRCVFSAVKSQAWRKERHAAWKDWTREE